MLGTGRRLVGGDGGRDSLEPRRDRPGQFLRMIKATPALAAIPVIMVTLEASIATRDRSRAAGCDLFLSIPLSPRRLIYEVAAFLGEARAPREL